MTALPASIPRAMIAQLDRVNTRKAHSLGDERSEPRREADLLDEIACLQDELARRDKRIAELELLLESLQGDQAVAVDQVRGAFFINGRPAATIKDVADSKGFSVTKVWRYVSEGWWQGERSVPGKHPMIVYLDQELVSRPPRRKKKGYSK